MPRYIYADLGSQRPPAPFVSLSLSRDGAGGWVRDLPALVDTGADQTVIPDRFVAQFGLVELDQVMVSGFGGPERLLPTYRVWVAIRDFPPVEVEVLTGGVEPHAILGRDVLNRYRVVLDGPAGRLDIG